MIAKIKYGILIAALLQGCYTRELEFDIPDAGDKIVINSIINPDSLFRANLSKTYSSLETDFLQFIFLDSAKARVFENEVYVGELEYQQEGTYRSRTFKPKQGKEYRLEIENIDERKVVASANVPANVPISGLFHRFIQPPDGFVRILNSGRYIRSKLLINDPQGENQYLFYLSAKHNNPFVAVNLNYTVSLGTSTEIEYDSESDNSGYYVFDNFGMEGQTITLNINLVFPEYLETGSDSLELGYNLLSINRDMYRYLNSLKTYSITDNSLIQYTEPSFVYSNVEGGLGIFGGYSRAFETLLLTLRK